MAQEVISCEVCERQNQKGVQLSLFDVVISARRQGEGTKSHITRSNHFTIEQFASRIDPRWLNGKTLRDYIAELIGTQPYDFAEMFAPRSLQDQSKRLELPMPPGMGGGPGPQQQYQQYQPAPAVYGAPPPGAQQPPPQMAPQQPGPQPAGVVPPPYYGR